MKTKNDGLGMPFSSSNSVCNILFQITHILIHITKDFYLT